LQLKSIFSRISREKLYLVSDGAGWILDAVAYHLDEQLSHRLNTIVDVKSRWKRSRNSLVHFIERSWAWQEDGFDQAPRENQYIGLWWHGKLDSKDPAIHAALDRVQKRHRLFSRIQVPTSIAMGTMLNVGVPENKLVLLPEGVDCSRFHLPLTESDRSTVRQQLRIPRQATVIGCFQKDGNGWEEGLTPKLIKGPDVLADAMKILNRKTPIFMLIPGPARGYLQKRFIEDGVPFINPGHVRHGQGLARLYHALDLYVSPSRDEGGPAGVMEAMASGVPVVSTKSGVAVDLFGDKENGILVDLEDPQGLAIACFDLINNSHLRQEMARRANHRIQAYHWTRLADQYYEKLYLPLTE
jgi:glycosyltransferase involved in cell wall biosynthesis